MNKTILIYIIITIAILVTTKFVLFGSKKNSAYSKSSNERITTSLIPNDKIVVVRNLKIEYLKKAIQQYCDLNRQDNYIVRPKLTITKDNLIITFPYDIEFEGLCYFINYLEYAHDLSLKPDYKPEIYGWYKTKSGDRWMTKEIINKEVMLYIPESDDEYDNVYLTTEDNLGFKMGFAIGHAHQKLNRPVVQFKKRPLKLSDLDNYESIQF